jgi:hypothetical protein
MCISFILKNSIGHKFSLVGQIPDEFYIRAEIKYIFEESLS